MPKIEAADVVGSRIWDALENWVGVVDVRGMISEEDKEVELEVLLSNGKRIAITIAEQE